MSFIPADFSIRELVHPQIYFDRGERAWELLDERATKMLQALRGKFGPIQVNNWHLGGNNRNSGLRQFSSPTGAVWSQHKFGRAFDCHPVNVKPQVMYDYVLAHPSEFPLITVLEDISATPTWMHFDVRWHDKGGIWVVNP